jgi:CBS-domain-containing membrane protein
MSHGTSGLVPGPAARSTAMAGPGGGPMLVHDVMQTQVVTVTPLTTLPEAIELSAERRIRHLPVVHPGGKLVGIVSDRDLKRVMASPATSLEARSRRALSVTDGVRDSRSSSTSCPRGRRSRSR